jgi:gamma-glutamyltranspeptidase/glutathione hydrolase
MVGADHPLAVAAGIDILRRGGNAMDAAIATALTTAVTLPSKCGLGGDAFFLFFEAKSGTVTAVNGAGIAPRSLSSGYFTARGYEKMPLYGPLSISVPGAVAAYYTAIDRWCTLPPKDLFNYAVHYARHGFPVSDGTAATLRSARDELAKYPSSARVFRSNGSPLTAGQFLVQEDLASTLETLVDSGPRCFYEGELAERLVAGLQQVGGKLAMSDFSDHQSEVYEPLSTSYRGYRIFETRPPSQGHILLEELNILENADVRALGHNTTAAIHLMVESKKRAFADRNAYSRDPNFGHFPLETLISKPFAATRFATIDPDVASDDVLIPAIEEHAGDTTYLCTADAEGNMVSFIHSLSGGFGSRVIAGDTGIMLNNRAGRGFSLVDGHPNVFEGGKRTMHTLNAYMIAEKDEVVVAGGTPGGDRQVQWNMQIITNLIDHEMDVQAAVEAPRWVSFPGTDPANLPHPYELHVESRIPAETMDELRERGHKVKEMGPYSGGGAAFLIRRDPATGLLEAGADPRGEGFAGAI